MLCLMCTCRVPCEARGVVKAYPVVDDPLRLEAISDFIQKDGLSLQGPPQSFNKDVVQITTPTPHRDFDAYFGECRDPASTCVLATLIRIHDLWLGVLGGGPFQRLKVRTFRVARSMIATEYRKPRLNGM